MAASTSCDPETFNGLEEMGGDEAEPNLESLNLNEAKVAAIPFTLKKWLVFARWSYDLQVDTCAICRSLFNELCMLNSIRVHPIPSVFGVIFHDCYCFGFAPGQASTARQILVLTRTIANQLLVNVAMCSIIIAYKGGSNIEVYVLSITPIGKW
eukprot:Gb_23484 [translate_table: standard]